ncbi:MAG: efflux RND transporter periplasmic adaptor subunit, partial [Acidobacteriota bacterium]
MSGPATGRTALLLAAAIGVSLVLGAIAGALLPLDRLGLRSGADAATTADEESADPTLWTCSMHPQVIQDAPGPCPICAMDLTPMPGAGGASHAHRAHDHAHHGHHAHHVAAPDDMTAAAGATVTIDPAVVQNMNVRTEIAARRDLARTIRTVGYLAFDEQRMVTVTTKYAGWIERVHVNYVGERVRKGQPLFAIYAPELVQTEQELLSALRFARDLDDAPADARARAWSMVEAARTRLGYWDVAPAQIAQLEETGEVFRTIEVAAPARGLVMKR